MDLKSILRRSLTSRTCTSRGPGSIHKRTGMERLSVATIHTLRYRFNSRKSPVRQVGLSTMGGGVRKPPQSRSSSASPSRSPGRGSYGSSDDNVNNNRVDYQMIRSQQQAKEEEKRRLQIEMRKRETELLNKIKQQQKELESMKQEKSKVQRSPLAMVQ